MDETLRVSVTARKRICFWIATAMLLQCFLWLNLEYVEI